MKSKILGLLVVGLLAIPLAAKAAVTVDVSEVAGSVVFSSSGTLNMTGATQTLGSYTDVVIIESIITGANWFYFQSSNSGVMVDSYLLSGYAGPFGSIDFTQVPATSSSGDAFGIWGSSYNNIPVLLISRAFVSGSAITGGLTFAGHTFASLGLTQGEYVYSLPNDTITLRIGTRSVPEPGTLALLGLGLMGLGLSRRRKA